MALNLKKYGLILREIDLALAIRSVKALTASKTAKKSLEVLGMCSGGSYDVEDGLPVSRGARAVVG